MPEPIRLILDTDMDTDCDDAGTLAVLHALMHRGEVDLLGVICSVPVPWTAAFVAAVDDWYGRAEIPVGLAAVPDWETHPSHAAYRAARENLAASYGGALYNEALGGPWTETHPDWKPREAVGLLRELLAAQPDGSVVVCAIGMLTALAQLLDSPGGEGLVRAKVRQLVTMALGTYPRGRDAFNWVMDVPAAARVLHGWPTPVVVSHLGEAVLTGARLEATAPEGQPVAAAYRHYLRGPGKSRSSWDQLATIHAVRGPGALLREHGGHGLRMDPETGEHEWAGEGERAWLEPTMGDAEMAEYVEGLMVESVGGR
jgi:inosine-uridine nucleoside N-ribohydrolase